VNRDGDKLLSEVKLYSPPHLLETQDHGLRAVYLVPTTLGRLFVRTERDAPVEVDGGLQTRLSSVTLMTDGGSIRVRDLQVIDYICNRTFINIFITSITDNINISCLILLSIIMINYIGFDTRIM